MQSKDDDDAEISFLLDDHYKGKKEANRQVYEKIMNAFLDENSLYYTEDDEQTEVVAGALTGQAAKQSKASILDEELYKAYADQYVGIDNTAGLDIVEMDTFDRIKLYQDHTIWQKIYKRLWKIKATITWAASRVVKNPKFETVSLTVILFNSVMLARDDPTSNGDNNAMIDLVLLIIYTVEMMFKITAMGFIFGKGAYLKDSWNILDIVIIGTGYLPYLSSSSDLNLSALRSLRVLRPLKSVTKIKSLKLLL